VGSGSRDVDAWRADVSVRRGSGAPDADGPGACLSQPLGVGVDSLVFIHLIPRIDHKIGMVINRLNHQREIKEFADRQVRCDQWKKRYLWKGRVEERLQFTRSDETRDDRAGVGASRATKRLERERETTVGGYTGGSIYPSSIFHWQSVHLSPPVVVCISSFPDVEDQ
jgi:hypothetical protein